MTDGRKHHPGCIIIGGNETAMKQGLLSLYDSQAKIKPFTEYHKKEYEILTAD